MKIRCALILSLLLLLASCGSQKRVVRGSGGSSQSYERVDPATLTRSSRRLLDEAYSWMGAPYRYGGKSRGGTDCSGFMMEVYRTSLGISLPRNSAKQSEFCRRIPREKMVPGDLVFFGRRGVSHVGMYVGDGRMIHASSSQGVIVSSLDETYYVKNFRHCGRVEQFGRLIAQENASNKKSTKPKDKRTDKKPSKKSETAPPTSPVRSVGEISLDDFAAASAPGKATPAHAPEPEQTEAPDSVFSSWME